MITVAQLVAAGIGPTQARAFADPLSAACALFDISTPARIAAFIAQAAHESMKFTRLEENLYYTTPERIKAFFSKVRSLEHASKLARNPEALANTVYANRLGNGDEASGDGFRYRGRGLFHLTGRANYTLAMVALNRHYVANPDLVAQPSDACLTAAHYWTSRNLNPLADSWQIDEITRSINGPAMLGAAERQQMSEEAMRAFA